MYFIRDYSNKLLINLAVTLLIIGAPGCQYIKQRLPHKNLLSESPDYAEPILRRPFRGKSVKVPAAIRKNIKTLTVQELEQIRTYALEVNDSDLYIRVLEQMETVVQSNDRLREIRLALCDAYFNEKQFEKALEHFTQYAQFYPGDSFREYAEYKAVLCSFYNTLDADRDQANTKKTLGLIESFLTRALHKGSETYIPEILEIKKTCLIKMAEHELTVLDFYLKKGNPSAARNRLTAVKKDFKQVAAVLEPRLLEREIKIAQTVGDEKTVQNAKTRLAALQQDSPSQLLALKETKQPYANRF